MSGIKSLVKETAVYGLSSIVGRFLNWILVPLYVYLFPASEYGIVSYLYSFTAVMLVILNYGMETGFFRFANRENNPGRVYTTALWAVGSTSFLFIILLTLFLPSISGMILMKEHPEYVWILGVTVAIDAFSNIPFAYLRYKNKAWTFAGIKFLNIGVNILLNIFFIIICPILERKCPGTIDWFYAPMGGMEYGIGWIFVANIISTVVVLCTLIPYMTGVRRQFDSSLLSRMLGYSWPLLILGVAGIASQNMGQLIIPYIFKGNEEAARTMVGIYGANIKIAVVMVMFTQAFRYAYEPFIFAQARAGGEDRRHAYCAAMKYFVIFGLLIFLGVMYFMPVLKHFISPGYWSGLRIVPIMMAADLFSGIFFNLSLWYKLTDRTKWGMYFSIICFILMFGLNLWLVPLFGIPDGYIGSAWAAFISYFIVMALSYLVGRRYYPLPYQTGRMFLYAILAAALFYVGERTEYPDAMWLTYIIRILMLTGYLCVVAFYEDIPVASPMTRRAVYRIFPRRPKGRKRSNVSRVAEYWLRRATPEWMLRNSMDMMLDGWEERNDAYMIRRRVDYYCRRRYDDTLPGDKLPLPSLPDNFEEASGRSLKGKDIREVAADVMPVREMCVKDIRPGKVRSQYAYDLYHWLSAWPGERKVRFVDGDNWLNPSLPAIVKTRRLDCGNTDNGIILNINSRRHFIDVHDPIPFSEKLPKLIFRGECSNKPARKRCLEMWMDSPLMDMADTSRPWDAPGHGRPVSVTDHFRYRYVLALEGNDVCSALYWIMASGSIPVMTRPKAEGWLMHGLMQPGVHYIEIADDFSDLEDKIIYYNEHPDEAESIAEASRKWARQFDDKNREAIISLLILKRYLGENSI